MGQEEVIVSLSPTWVRVASCRSGRIERMESESIDPARWADAWAEGLRPLDGALNAAITRLGPRPGSDATVVYVGPDSHVDVCSVPASGRAAHFAAELALREAVPDAAARLNAVRLLHADAPGPSGAGGEAPRTHMQIVSESSMHAEHLGGWLKRAGLGTRALMPLKSLLLSAAVQEAASLPGAGSQAVIWLDDHSTALAARTNGRLQFVRTVDVGFAQLADAVVKGATACGLTMERKPAYAMVFGVGIPRRGQTMDSVTGLKAEAVLPLMQSILQRFVVEAKQTLRFGLPEGELARATVQLAGPGARIPGVCEMFADSLDWAVTGAGPPESGVKQEDWGEVALVGRAGASCPVLLPRGEVLARLDRRLGRAVVAGLLLGALGLGAWTFRTNRALAHADARLDGLGPRIEAMHSLESRTDYAKGLAMELTGATRLTGQILGNRTDLQAALSALTRLTPESIDLSEVTLAYTGDAKGAPVLTLRGVAWPAEAGREPAGDPLSEYLDRLSRSPVLESARIVSTRAEMSGGTDVKQFTISGVVRALPPVVPLPAGGAR